MANSEINDTKLVLVSARKSRAADFWDKDDYDVRLGDGSGPVVGRILHHPQATGGQPWFWTITARSLRVMNKAMIVEHLTLAERHIAEGEQRIERQRQIVRELHNDGRDLATAMILLTQFEELHLLHIKDRDRARAALVNH